MSGTFTLLRPEAWPLLLLAPAALALLVLSDRARGARLHALLGPRPRRTASELAPQRRLARRVLVAAGVLAVTSALLRPAWGDAARPAPPRVDVAVCLDVSRSMLARDVAPSRLAAAKGALRTLAEGAPGERFALVVFAGEPRLVVPLTRDAATFAELVDSVDPLSVGRGGTDLGTALLAAADALPEGGGVVLLVTDGEDHGGRGLAAAQALRGHGVVVHAAGLGTPLGGRVTVADGSGESFLRDASGGEVVSTLDAAALRRVAEATGGTYVDASAGEGALLDLYERRLVPAARAATHDDERRRRRSRAPWPLAAAFVAWLAALALGEQLRR